MHVVNWDIFGHYCKSDGAPETVLQQEKNSEKGNVGFQKIFYLTLQTPDVNDRHYLLLCL